MGIIRDLKNIFFGASSITKSAAEKAGDFVKEEGAELLDKTKDLASKSGDVIADKTAGLKDSILENSGDFLDKTKEKLSDLGEDIMDNPLTEKFGELSENIGEKVHSKGGDLMDKAAGLTEDVGEKVMSTGGVLLDKSKDLSEDVGSKVLDVKDKFMEKAEVVKDKLSEKLDETMDKADAWAAEQKANPKPDFAEETLNASGSLLEGKDDFFSKADKFASGEYDAFSEGKITVEDGNPIVKEDFESLPPATGFKDLDGDGNEIIDDAIIEE